jgi:hypothetical protein
MEELFSVFPIKNFSIGFFSSIRGDGGAFGPPKISPKCLKLDAVFGFLPKGAELLSWRSGFH